MIIETNLQILDALRQSLDVVLIALIYNFNQGHESQSILLLVSQSLQGELDAGEMICALDHQQKTKKRNANSIRKCPFTSHCNLVLRNKGSDSQWSWQRHSKLPCGLSVQPGAYSCVSLLQKPLQCQPREWHEL